MSNSVFNGEANENSIEGRELLQANKISNLPLKLVIGNPPCSDTLRENVSEDFSIINELIAEYAIDTDTMAFSPVKPFNTEMYKKFWPVSDENGQNAIFLNHCSGIKLAPTAIFTHVKAPMLKRRSREMASNGATEVVAWFSRQDRPPKEEKIIAFQNALNECGDRRVMDQTLADNIHSYSFRPFLTSNVLLWEDVLLKYKAGQGYVRR